MNLVGDSSMWSAVYTKYFSLLLILADDRILPPTFHPAYDYIFSAGFDALIWQAVIERLAQKGKWRVSVSLCHHVTSRCVLGTHVLPLQHKLVLPLKAKTVNIYCCLVQMSWFLGLWKMLLVTNNFWSSFLKGIRWTWNPICLLLLSVVSLIVPPRVIIQFDSIQMRETALRAPGLEEEEVLQAQSKGFLCSLSQAKGKIQLRFIRETLLLSHKVQKGPTCFPSASEKCLGAAGSNPTPRLGEWFMFKRLYMCNRAFMQLCPTGSRMTNQIYLYE